MTAAGSALGRVAGWAAAPFFGAVSFARQARTFHPRGPVFHAAVVPHASVPGQFRALAERLRGPALVRFSGALWKHAESIPDVLGCAIRVRRTDEETSAPEGDDQDLLFATIRRPWTMPLSPLTTDTHDYLGNDYFAVSPFDVGVGHQVYLRLHPERASGTQAGGTRSERLAGDVARGDAQLVLGASARPFGPWSAVAGVTLERVAHVDGEALRFRPFRVGRGLEPRGFVHALRRGVYAVSQRARPEHG